MANYQDLEVYKLAHELAVVIHAMTLEQLPKFEMFEQGSQVRRSSKSVSSAIVEGFGRKQYQQEYARYLTFALASVDETKEHLQLLFDTKSLNDKMIFQSLIERYEELGRKLFRLRNIVKAAQEQKIALSI